MKLVMMAIIIKNIPGADTTRDMISQSNPSRSPNTGAKQRHRIISDLARQSTRMFLVFADCIVVSVIQYQILLSYE